VWQGIDYCWWSHILMSKCVKVARFKSNTIPFSMLLQSRCMRRLPCLGTANGLFLEVVRGHTRRKYVNGCRSWHNLCGQTQTPSRSHAPPRGVLPTLTGHFSWHMPSAAHVSKPSYSYASFIWAYLREHTTHRQQAAASGQWKALGMAYNLQYTRGQLQM